MKKQVDINSGLNWVEKILKLSKKYSFLDIIKALVILLFTGYVVLFALNPDYIFRVYEEKKKKEHTLQLSKRLDNSLVITTELENLLYLSGADRAFLIEFHNSIKSVEGFPYAYGSMNYEVVKDSVCYVSDEYANFSLTKYTLVSYMLKNNLFLGEIDAIKPIDNRLYLKFLSNEVSEIALIVVEGTDLPLGILGLTYCNDNKIEDSQTIKALLRKEVLKISLYLTR